MDCNYICQCPVRLASRFSHLCLSNCRKLLDFLVLVLFVHFSFQSGLSERDAWKLLLFCAIANEFHLIFIWHHFEQIRSYVFIFCICRFHFSFERKNNIASGRENHIEKLARKHHYALVLVSHCARSHLFYFLSFLCLN